MKIASKAPKLIVGRVPFVGERILYAQKDQTVLVGTVESSWNNLAPHFACSILYAPGKAIIARGNTVQGFWKQ